MLKWYADYKNRHPIIMFMILVKLSWVMGFAFTVMVIEGTLPTLRQWGLASIYTIITLPLNYYLTYCFNVKDTSDEDDRLKALELKQEQNERQIDFLNGLIANCNTKCTRKKD